MSVLPKYTMNRERGQTTAEFVLIAPFLFLLFFLMVDFGWMLKNWIVVTNTAREVDRCAIVDNCALNGTPVAPIELALGKPVPPATPVLEGRLQAGLTTNLENPDVQICYIEQNGKAGPNAGDSLVVIVTGDNAYITPVFQFLGLVSGGVSSALPEHSLPIKAREEMLLERDPTFKPAPEVCS